MYKEKIRGLSIGKERRKRETTYKGKRETVQGC